MEKIKFRLKRQYKVLIIISIILILMFSIFLQTYYSESLIINQSNTIYDCQGKEINNRMGIKPSVRITGTNITFKNCIIKNHLKLKLIPNNFIEGSVLVENSDSITLDNIIVENSYDHSFIISNSNAKLINSKTINSQTTVSLYTVHPREKKLRIINNTFDRDVSLYAPAIFYGNTVQGIYSDFTYESEICYESQGNQFSYPPRYDLFELEKNIDTTCP